jgi:prophage antirepressor-like protein
MGANPKLFHCFAMDVVSLTGLFYLFQILSIMTPQKEQTGTTVPMEFKFNSAERPIRVEIIQESPWFVVKDVCEALCISNYRDATNKLDEDEKLVSEIPTSGQRRKMLFINESGIYSLIFRSNKPEAKLFRKWVTNEVLPAIRRTGQYSPTAGQITQESDNDPERNQEALVSLIYQAVDVAGNQQTLASYLQVSPSVLTDLRNRPGKISVKLMRRVIYGCKKVVKLGAVPVEEIRDINVKEILQMWFDIVKIENYELRTSLSHRIARVLGREDEFCLELSELKEEGGRS